MFFGKNKTSLKLTKLHPEMPLGCEYLIVESAINPKKIKVGSGLTQLFLKTIDGEEYLIEGNISKIKEMFTPTKTFTALEGKLYKVTRPVGNFLQNEIVKQIEPCQYDEKLQFGNGISEQYFIQKNTNKIIKVYGNSSQIKSLFEEVIVQQPKPNKPNAIQTQTKIEVVERTIIKESTPVVGPQGFQGEKGERGNAGDVGPQGPIGPAGPQGKLGPQGEPGPIGPQGEKGEKGDKGDPGLQGEKGDKGDKGDRGDKGDVGPQGPQGLQGIQGPEGKGGAIGPQGIQGTRGERGEKGDKGDPGIQGKRGPIGPQGPEGPQGAQGLQGERGEKGDPGEANILNVEYPLVLENGTLQFDSTKLTKTLDKFRNDDIQKAIDKVATTIIPTGGGAVGIMEDGQRIVKSVSDINFTGPGVDVTRQGKNVTVNITGGGGGGAVNKLLAGPGITLSPQNGVGNVEITNLISVKGVPGDIQIANSDGDLEFRPGFKFDDGTTDLNIPKGLKLDSESTYGEGAFIEFPDGTTQGTASTLFVEGITLPFPKYAGDRWFNINDGNLYTAITDDSGLIWVQLNAGIIGPTGPQGNTGATAPNKFYYQTTSPSGVTQGDRWMDSDNGIEYVYIYDGNTNQWVQPTNTGGSSSTTISVLSTTTVTGATYAALPSDYYIGVSYAGPVTITLPTNPETGREIVVKDESGNAGNGVSRQITIVGATAAHKIDNKSSAIINLDNAGLHFIYRSGWRII